MQQRIPCSPLNLIWQQVVKTVSSISQTSTSPNTIPTGLHMQSRITAMIFNRTTSSPDESLGSNLQWETAELSSRRAISSAGDSGVIRPHENSECRDVNAADVIGPVESGERMIAKNGDKRVVKGTAWISKGEELTRNRTEKDELLRAVDTPDFSFEFLEVEHQVSFGTSMLVSRRIR
jgi:hypothetical protein